jgi:hypothetical protein
VGEEGCKSTMKNLRIKDKPQEKHEDFEINEVVIQRLKEKTKNKQFDFFIKKIRYGNTSFNIFFHSWEELQLHKFQYFMIKCKDKEVERLLKQIDYDKISTVNVCRKLVSRYDVVEAYKRIKNNEKLANNQ